MISDPIIDELHSIREKIYDDCNAKGISSSERHKDLEIPKDLKKANLKPAKVDFSKVKTTPVKN